MTKLNELPTAFPWMHKDITCTGMTLRDYFAARAMQALLSDPEWRENLDVETPLEPSEFTAQSAYLMADAMIKARGQE